jgi:SAM-dependent methyltransferase
MVDRIAAIIASTARRGRPFAHILDVGGGRGDLALALAQRFATKVTVVDRNATSVAAGQARAEAWNPAACRDGQIHFVVADFQAYATSNRESAGQSVDHASLSMPPPSPPVDLVVALHACGDLSDAALHHATHTLHGCSFLICPCCYTKRYLTTSFWEPALSRNGSFVATMDTTEPVHAADANPNSMDSIRNPLSSWDAPTISTLLRLAELNEHPNVRHRAATLINTARLQRSVDTVQLCHAINESDDVQQRPTCKTNNSYSTLQLEEFSNSYSTRNLVLVGIAFNPPGRSTEKSTS